MIDLRSDTVTRPTPAMLEAMLSARVGDDVYGEDETVDHLQRKAAAMFEMEAALFCPSGTMTNQIGIKVHTRPGDEVICSQLAHVYRYEGGGIASLSGASVRLLEGSDGRFSAAAVVHNINRREDPHYPHTRLVAIENTTNLGGGRCWDLTDIERIRAVADQHQLALHLDGARLFNALIARDHMPAQYGRLFDTISICLSKGLGAPVGSLLLGSQALIAEARRWRKVMGGGMRQAGYLAAAGMHALDHHVDRLRLDHDKAIATGRELSELPYVAQVLPVETNIVIFRLERSVTTAAFLKQLEARQIKALAVGAETIRFVFHLDITDAMFEQIREALRSLRKKSS